jgi:hypothetical protein
MSITHLAALRTILADTVDAAVNSGGGTAKFRLRASSTVIVDFDLANPAFGAAVAGVITLAGVPISAAAIAGGVVDNFQVLARDGTVSFSGSVTGVGGGGDVELSNTNVANGQDCSLDSFTYAAPP